MARQLKPCGTPAAFRRHQKAGETPCNECRKALNAYMSTIYYKRRAKEIKGEVVGSIVDELIRRRYVWNKHRNNVYPYYKWEIAEQKEHLLPMQSVLHDLFPYNSEKVKPCKCCNGTGQRNG